MFSKYMPKLPGLFSTTRIQRFEELCRHNRQPFAFMIQNESILEVIKHKNHKKMKNQALKII